MASVVPLRERDAVIATLPGLSAPADSKSWIDGFLLARPAASNGIRDNNGQLEPIFDRLDDLSSSDP